MNNNIDPSISNFISNVNDEPLKRYLIMRYLKDSNSERKDELNYDIYMLTNHIRENRCNQSYYKKANKEWKQKNRR
jgi:hypothetical protein